MLVWKLPIWSDTASTCRRMIFANYLYGIGVRARVGVKARSTYSTRKLSSSKGFAICY